MAGVLTMTLSQAARYLGHVNDDYVRRLVRAGTLPAELVGHRYEIPASAVEAYRIRVAAKRSSASSTTTAPAPL
jgi:excisionase family DNA binding protein